MVEEIECPSDPVAGGLCAFVKNTYVPVMSIITFALTLVSCDLEGEQQF